MNDSITYIRHFKHTNARNICCYVFYWITIIQYQSMNDNKCIIWIKKFEYLCEVSLKQNLDLHESFEWIRLFWWEGFQIFHYFSFCAANNFFVVFLCIKNVRKISFAQGKRRFFWHFLIDSKKSTKKWFNSEYACKWVFYAKSHIFKILGAERSKKKRLKNLKTKGTPFWFLPFLLVFRICP